MNNNKKKKSKEVGATKSKMQSYDNKRLYILNPETIEKWQEEAGWENRKLIRRWASLKEQLDSVARELKDAKSEVAESFQEEKNNGAKMTEKVLLALIDGNPDVQRCREKRDALQVEIDELYQVMLLYRDMWQATPTIRQGTNILMKHELEMED